MKGKYIDEKGNIFEGSYENHQKSGQGKLTKIDGTILEGTWVHNKLTGIAKETKPDGSQCFVKYDDFGKEQERNCR